MRQNCQFREGVIGKPLVHKIICKCIASTRGSTERRSEHHRRALALAEFRIGNCCSGVFRCAVKSRRRNVTDIRDRTSACCCCVDFRSVFPIAEYRISIFHFFRCYRKESCRLGCSRNIPCRIAIANCRLIFSGCTCQSADGFSIDITVCIRVFNAQAVLCKANQTSRIFRFLCSDNRGCEAVFDTDIMAYIADQAADMAAAANPDIFFCFFV